MERWDLLDEKGNKTGKTITKKHEFKENDYHLFVHIWIVNSKGEMLIQKRADHLKNAAGLWAITGGAVFAGEDSMTAAKREVKEELGIDIKLIGKPVRHRRRNAFTDIWLAQSDVNLEDIVLQKEEVTDVKWVRGQELKLMLEKGVFQRYDDKYFAIVKDMLR